MSRTGRQEIYHQCQEVNAGPEQRSKDVASRSAVAENLVVFVEKVVVL